MDCHQKWVALVSKLLCKVCLCLNARAVELLVRVLKSHGLKDESKFACFCFLMKFFLFFKILMAISLLPFARCWSCLYCNRYSLVISAIAYQKLIPVMDDGLLVTLCMVWHARIFEVVIWGK